MGARPLRISQADDRRIVYRSYLRFFKRASIRLKVKGDGEDEHNKREESPAQRAHGCYANEKTKTPARTETMRERDSDNRSARYVSSILFRSENAESQKYDENKLYNCTRRRASS